VATAINKHRTVLEYASENMKNKFKQ